MSEREQPAWVGHLAEALAEALPRLLQLPADAELASTIGRLTTALTEGELEIALEASERQRLEHSPLLQGEAAPLVLTGGRLQWRRWHEQRGDVLAALARRAGPDSCMPGSDGRGPGEEPGWQALVERHGQGLDAAQRQAVAAVLRQRLVLLEGGPGTGKTSTVARMLAAVREQQPGCRIQLAAPTGKAAARLRAAIAAHHPDLRCSTLHRLLESQGERFRRNRHQPLALDLLVVDELSMVDLGLMQALLEALPEAARLVLVGDAAQLAPVAPGPVLLDLQRPANRRLLGGAVVQLGTSYRNQGAIAAFGQWLRQGLDGTTTPSLQASPLPAGALEERLTALEPEANLHWHRGHPLALPAPLLERLRQWQRQLQQLSHPDALASPTGPEQLLAALEQLLVLSPVHRGPWGVEAVHRQLLGDSAGQGPDRWPLGTPVLCSSNDDSLGLANGDLGVVVERQGQRRLLFAPGGGEEVLWIHPAQLPAARPALALTVHKAQGSEAAEVWVLLPDRDRTDGRLLYTALTRARQHAHLLTPERP